MADTGAPGIRTWADIASSHKGNNRSITLFTEQGFEQTRRAKQAENIIRSLNANSVIFDFGTNLPSKETAYRTIMQLGPIIGIRTIGRSRNPRALLIEVRFGNDETKQKAINEGITYDNHTYLATPALAADADIVKVNFKELPFVEPEPLHASLKNTMRHYRKVSQIRVYVDPATGLYEGEATVILDITPPADYMNDDDDEPYYKPLTSSWKNAPPLCRYCKKEGHKKDDCPKMIDMECYYCHTKGHQQRNCHVRRADEKRKRYAEKIDHMSAEELLATYPEITQTFETLQQEHKKNKQQLTQQMPQQQQSFNTDLTTIITPLPTKKKDSTDTANDDDSEMKDADTAYQHNNGETAETAPTPKRLRTTKESSTNLTAKQQQSNITPIPDSLLSTNNNISSPINNGKGTESSGPNPLD
ncbi:hypothetical protein INT45_009021 [Circinella minor]|uniref:CCHC-type domain-containing protein n=1 Tax=Circinella minor TaxID=1195481 RepID=A0A8H7VJ31_9FUNG|nr:hypothetical protein INT45_009021 [Circinella minor]